MEAGKPDFCDLLILQQVVRTRRTLQPSTEDEHSHAVISPKDVSKQRESYMGPEIESPAACTILASLVIMTNSDYDTDWRRHLIDDDEGIERVIAATRRIAVLGIKTDPDQPAHYVPAYAQQAGFEIV